MLDGLLQSVLGVWAGQEGVGLLPFAVEEVRVRGGVPPRCYAHVKQLGERKYNFELLNESGEVVVALNEVTLRRRGAAAVEGEGGGLLYVPRWERESWQDVAPKRVGRVWVIGGGESEALLNALVSEHGEQAVTVASAGDFVTEAKVTEWLKSAGEVSRIYYLCGVGAPEPVSVERLRAVEEATLLGLFRLLKGLSQSGRLLRELELLVVTSDSVAVGAGARVNPESAGVWGLAKAVGKEYPALRVSVVDVSFAELESGKARELAVALSALEPFSVERGEGLEEVVLRGGQRYVRRLRAAQGLGSEHGALRRGAVYVLVGGAGGIGSVLAEYLAKQYGARLVLVGRRSKDSTIVALLARIERAGGHGIYVKADVSEACGAEAIVARAKEQYGAIHGVFHLGIELHDGALLGMSETSFRRSLLAKTQGSVGLQQALAGERLELVVFFSSAQSFWPNAGQCNYAAACSFQDAYGHYLATVCGLPVRILNWGLWGQVGAVAAERHQDAFVKQGVLPLGVREALVAMETASTACARQVVVFKGTEAAQHKLGVDATYDVELCPAKPEVSSAQLVEALNGCEGPSAEEQQRCDAGYEELERWGRALLWQRLFARDPVGSAAWDEAAEAQRRGVVAEYRPLWSALISVLERGDYLVRRGGRVERSSKAAQPALSDAELLRWQERLAREYPAVSGHSDLMWATLANAPQILTGAVPATDVVFPGSSLRLVERCYAQDPVAERCNRLTAAAVRGFAQGSREARAGLRILEVGAGTGSTTRVVLGALAPEQPDEYVFTDVSRAFLRRAQSELAPSYSCLRFETLDLEKAPEQQGFAPGGFDLVVASNVLHATRNIRKTLAHLKSLVSHNGWLMINEITDNSDHLSMTFGFLKGWWLFEDPETRIAGSPLLALGSWRTLLAEEGLALVGAQDADWGAGRSQHLIVAASDGQICHRARRAARPAQASPQRADEPTSEVAARPAHRSLQTEITRIVCDVLKISSSGVRTDTPFVDLGVDSLLAIQVITRINAELRVELRTTDLFNFSNISDLSRNIAESLAAQAGSVGAGAAVPAATQREVAVDVSNSGPTSAETELLELLTQLEAGALSVDDVERTLGGHHG